MPPFPDVVRDDAFKGIFIAVPDEEEAQELVHLVLGCMLGEKNLVPTAPKDVRANKCRYD